MCSMALLQISEPGDQNTPHARKFAVGIDLGTSHSLVATMKDAIPTVLSDEAGQRIHPSVVRYGDDIIVGAIASAEAADYPNTTVASIKRLMGRRLDELDDIARHSQLAMVQGETGMVSVKIAETLKSPVEVSADILRHLKKIAEANADKVLEGAVITVPAYFDDAQRQATKDAAKLAGIPVLRLINEPTAAAVAYGLDQQKTGQYLVFDLGGGTFDVSILSLEKDVFQVLATGGDSALGGDDFDRAIADHVLKQLHYDPSDLSAHEKARLLLLAKKAKEALSANEVAHFEFLQSKIELSRSLFASLIMPYLSKMIDTATSVLKDAKLEASDLNGVLLVGGSTRALAVKAVVESHFPVTIFNDIDPDEVVALGAAIQADMLIGNKADNDILLLDVIPLSLGIETMGGLVEKIIERNTTIPVTRAQEFTTYQDHQTAMAIHVVQGDRETVAHCRSLARFELRGIPAMKAGAARIVVSFQIDADGLLSVTAEEKITGTASHVQVKPAYGLSDEVMSSMLNDAFSHAEEDMKMRALIEERIASEQLLDMLQTAMNEDSALLDQEDVSAIEKAVQHLRQVMNQENPESIRQAVEALNEASYGFAAKRMDKAVKTALTGKTIDEV